MKCGGCGNRTKAYPLCRTCKFACIRAHKRIDEEGLIVDEAGTTPELFSWWVWSAKGEVLVIGKKSRLAALLALGMGENAEEDGSS
jgi:hypothetical protein